MRRLSQSIKKEVDEFKKKVDQLLPSNSLSHLFEKTPEELSKLNQKLTFELLSNLNELKKLNSYLFQNLNQSTIDQLQKEEKVKKLDAHVFETKEGKSIDQSEIYPLKQEEREGKFIDKSDIYDSELKQSKKQKKVGKLLENISNIFKEAKKSGLVQQEGRLEQLIKTNNYYDALALVNVGVGIACDNKVADLILAVSVNDSDFVKAVLDSQDFKDINDVVNIDEKPILIIAMEKKDIDIEIVKLLIEKGADFKMDYMGHTPLDLAKMNKREDLVDLLVSKGATKDETKVVEEELEADNFLTVGDPSGSKLDSTTKKKDQSK